MVKRVVGAIAAFGAVVSLAMNAPAVAQPIDVPYLVRDIADSATDPQADSSLSIAVAVGGRALLWASADSLSAEPRWVLWSTDGTAGGTVPISDLLGNEATNSLTSSELCLDEQRWLFWTRDSSAPGAGVWSTDGTNAGTSLAAQFSPGTMDAADFTTSAPCEKRRLNGQILFWTRQFYALEGPTYELWSTDGSAAGTQRVAMLGQDPASGGGGGFPGFVRLGDAIVFSLQTMPGAFKLWRTDGTEAGTGPFLSQIAGTQILMARGLARVGESAFFVGDNGSDPAPLAVTNGTAAGTRVFESHFPVVGTEATGFEFVTLPDRLVFPGSAGGSLQLWAVAPADLVPLAMTTLVDASWIWRLSAEPIGGRALFGAKISNPPQEALDLLIGSDGTAVGTVELAVGCGANGPCTLRELGRLGEEEYLLVSNGSSSSLWKTNGIAAGTQLVEPDVCPAECESFPMGASGAQMYFLARAAGGARALWVTDGTAAGTLEILAPGAVDLSRAANDGTAALPGNRLLFEAEDFEFGSEPWITDGTPSGTHRIVNLSTASDPSQPKRFSANGDRVLFSAQESVHGPEPWVSGGSAGNTAMVADIRPGLLGSDPLPFQPADGLWPMIADPEGTGSSQSLYYTTGAPGDLDLLDPEVGWGSSSVSFNGRTLFTGAMQLLVFDGNPPSVSALAEIGGGFDLFPFLAVGAQQVYFRNLLAAELHDLWATDGTAAGTHSFCEAPSFQSFSPGSWIGELGSGVVFKARTEALGVETYFCREGEAAILLADIAVGAADADPEGFAAIAGWSLFAATDAAGDRELWRTDGTVAGTSPLANLSPTGSSAPAEFIPVAGGVLFTANDGQHGRELWFSDGTVAGTAMVADLAPGPMSSQPAGFEPIGGALVFAAETLAAGRELWVTAGTSESTGPLPEIRPGPLSSWPEELTATQHRVFLRATDERGSELWALCPSWVAGTSQACNELFMDGFEGGSIDRWSASTP